jgi:hypothetical protein
MKYIKVKFIKAAPKFAYTAGDVGMIDADRAPDLVKGGYVIPLPDEYEPVKNPLPEDLPGRDKLFEAGFDTVKKIKEAGDGLLDAGISKTMLTKIKKYLIQ